MIITTHRHHCCTNTEVQHTHKCVGTGKVTMRDNCTNEAKSWGGGGWTKQRGERVEHVNAGFGVVLHTRSAVAHAATQCAGWVVVVIVHNGTYLR